MFKRQSDEQLYFSTKVELKIGQTIFRPSMCYKVPSLAKGSLDKFAEKGVVTYYASPVRFVNGAVAIAPAGQKPIDVPSISEEVKTVKRK